MSAIPAADHGLTDRLDPLLGDRFGRWLDLVDERAGVRVDDTGITVRGLVRARHTSWDRVERVELDNRLDVVLAAATRFLPVRRLPVAGGLLSEVVTDATAALTRRVAPRQREQVGWVVATIHRDGVLHRDIDVEGGAWLTAVLHPDLAETVRAHAEMRHIPVERH